MAERRGERMADKLGGWVPEFIENEVEREPIIRLAKMITDRIPQKLGLAKITKYDPEYWGLAAMCTDEQAEIAMKMGVRKPKTLDQAHRQGRGGVLYYPSYQADSQLLHHNTLLK